MPSAWLSDGQAPLQMTFTANRQVTTMLFDHPPRRRLGAISATVLLASMVTVPSVPASAQAVSSSDVVVMRRVIARQGPGLATSFSLLGESTDPKNFVYTSSAGAGGRMTRVSSVRWYVPGYNNLGLRTGNGQVIVHPDLGGANAGVSFIAPRDGDYRFVGKFMSLDVCGDGITAVANGTRSLLVTGDLPFSFTKRLSRGEALPFVVEPNQNPNCDGTGLEIDVQRL